MPYDLIKEIESMAMDVDIAEWHDEDDFVPELAPILIRVQEWMSRLLRDVYFFLQLTANNRRYLMM